MQHESRNISMLMDFYEMTMAHGYFTKLKNVDRVAFDVFFRRNPDKGGFAIFGGLEQIVEYILNLHFDESDISYLRSQGIFSEEFFAKKSPLKLRGRVKIYLFFLRVFQGVNGNGEDNNATFNNVLPIRGDSDVS